MRIGPKDVMRMIPCKESGWDAQRVHRFFRNTIKRREIELKDIFRFFHARIFEESDLIWLFCKFAPKHRLHELAEKIKETSARYRVAYDKLKELSEEEMRFATYATFEPDETDEEVVDYFLSTKRRGNIELMKEFIQ